MLPTVPQRALLWLVHSSACGLWRVMTVAWSATLVLLQLCHAVTLNAADGDAQQARLDLNLFQAAERGDFGAIDAALEAGADIDALIPVGPRDNPDLSKVTALMQAALNGQVDTLNYLLEQGADADQEDSFGFTPMHGCAFRGQTAACAALLKDVGAQSETALHYHPDGYAPMHRCCFGEGNVDTLRAFLEAGVDPALATTEDRVGRGGRPGMTCKDVATSDEIKALLSEYDKGDPKGKGKRRGSKTGRKGSRRKKKVADEQELSVDDILASHPDL